MVYCPRPLDSEILWVLTLEAQFTGHTPAPPRQLRSGADRARQKIELEMLDGTKMVRVVEAAGGGVWMGADAESAAEAGGHPIDDIGDVDHGRVWAE